MFGRDGYLYGVTTSPPAFPIAFRINTSGDSYSVVARFYNTGLGTPEKGLVLASDGILYGVATLGVYFISPVSGFHPLYFFNTPTDGAGTDALIQAADGNLYGANYSGPGNTGTVFRVALDGTFQKILNLSGATTGTSPNALLRASDGDLWGTTLLSSGGGAGGKIYRVTTDGALLDSTFLTTAGTGIQPAAPLIQGTDGKLYGTTSAYGRLANGQFASGTIFVVDAGLTSSLTSIAVTAPNTSIANGTSQQFTATGTYGDNSVADLTAQVEWHSSVPGVATFGAGTGLASAVATGWTEITASLNGVTSNAFVMTVTAPTPPVVTAYRVLFGSQSYTVTGSARKRLPWQITGIQVVFSKPIATGSVTSLGGVTATALSGLGTDTLTWTVPPLSLGAFVTSLSGRGANVLQDAQGSPLAAGAGFSQDLKVLLGDFNDDGVVSSADLVGVNNAIVVPYNVMADITGDGAVNAADVQLVRTRIGTSQP